MPNRGKVSKTSTDSPLLGPDIPLHQRRVASPAVVNDFLDGELLAPRGSQLVQQYGELVLAEVEGERSATAQRRSLEQQVAVLWAGGSEDVTPTHLASARDALTSAALIAAANAHFGKQHTRYDSLLRMSPPEGRALAYLQSPQPTGKFAAEEWRRAREAAAAESRIRTLAAAAEAATNHACDVLERSVEIDVPERSVQDVAQHLRVQAFGALALNRRLDAVRPEDATLAVDLLSGTPNATQNLFHWYGQALRIGETPPTDVASRLANHALSLATDTIEATVAEAFGQGYPSLSEAEQLVLARRVLAVGAAAVAARSGDPTQTLQDILHNAILAGDGPDDSVSRAVRDSYEDYNDSAGARRQQIATMLDTYPSHIAEGLQRPLTQAAGVLQPAAADRAEIGLL